MCDYIKKARDSMERIEDLKISLDKKISNFSDLLHDKFANTGSDFDTYIYNHFILGAEKVSPGKIGRCLRYDRYFSIDRERFNQHLDFSKWVQMRTAQDNMHYGMWCNPQLLSILEMADKDISIWVFANIIDFKDTLRGFLNSDFRKVKMDLGDAPCDYNKEIIYNL